MILDNWSYVLAASFNEIWLEVARIVPNIIVALLVLIVGWLIGSVLGGIVAQVVRALRLDKALEGVGVDELTARAGIRLDSGLFLGGLVKWFMIVAFLMASVNILGLTEVSLFLRDIVLGYLPNVIVAAMILLLAAYVGDVVNRLVVHSARAAGYHGAAFIGTVSRWAIWISSILVALTQLGIAEDFAQTLYKGVVYMLVLAGGLAFGLGGKEVAAEILENLKNEVTHKSK